MNEQTGVAPPHNTMSALLERSTSVDKDERGTPRVLFEKLHAAWGFTVDVAASPDNAKLPRYYTKEVNGLAQDWHGERVWCNPPYSDITPWLLKAIEESVPIVLLLPAATDTAWFHDLALPYFDIEFMRGRVKFEGFDAGAKFGSLLASMGRPTR